MPNLGIRIAAAACAVLIVAQAKAQEKSAGYPIAIEHAFGMTTIDKKPERIATVGWGNHEVPLALGVVPVGFAYAGFGDDDGDGVLPWVEERLEELGAETPVLFDENDGVDFEAVAATEPDVILAAYSGLSRSDYETLSQIAPVVAYPPSESSWTTPWRETVLFNSRGMGMEAEGEALVATIEGDIRDALASRPELEGKSAMFITHLDANDLSEINFYTAKDTRVEFFDDLGLHSPDAVQEASRSGGFSGSVSAERIDSFDDVDIVVTYGGERLLDAIRKNPLLTKMPAIGNGALVLLGNDPVATAANPTPLAISWALEDYVGILADAAAKAE